MSTRLPQEIVDRLQKVGSAWRPQLDLTGVIELCIHERLPALELERGITNVYTEAYTAKLKTSDSGQH